MREGERAVAISREWAAKADNDLTTAGHMLRLGKSCPTDIVCFHAQQCVEKYLKAPLTSQEQATLTAYATAARYPGWEDIRLAAARRAVAVARRVRRETRRWLSKRRQRPKRGHA